MRHKHSDYMEWAKTRSRARFNLASSGVAPFSLRDLPFDPATLEINGDNSYGYAPLQEAIARHCSIDPECVVQAAGTAMANHLAMAAMLEPGDEVLIEHPVYSLIPDVAQYLEAGITYFHRREEDGWAIDPAEVRRAITARSKLVILTNLHNPTSVLTPETVLRELVDITRHAGACLLVDEVYLDAVFAETPRSAFHLGENVVVTNSLTKVYGASGIRCGWILAQPELAWKMRRLNDLFSATPVHPGELLGVAVFQNLALLRDRARALVERDRTALASFLKRVRALAAVDTPWGTTSFPRLRNGGCEEFLARLRDEFETSVVPGRFFGMPEYFRIGLGVNPDMFAEGLRRLELALDREGTVR